MALLSRLGSVVAHSLHVAACRHIPVTSLLLCSSPRNTDWPLLSGSIFLVACAETCRCGFWGCSWLRSSNEQTASDAQLLGTY
ncbi:hypothetical protein C8Q74DRAFT_485635 [Fomes fomentarius]|nr:hypothetical protein C8Q74DRAFT_485635 [Fomes fomentarius]